MAKQVIDFGTGYNDPNSGDTDGVAWEKVISNFNELYGGAQNVTTNNIDFSNPIGAFVGAPTDVKTGDFTIVEAGEENGRIALCFHEGGAPNLVNGTVVGELGNYAVGVVNLIGIIVFDKANSLYLMSYAGEVKNIPLSGDTTAPSTPGTAVITDEGGDTTAPSTPGTAVITDE